jgi:peptide/nickel transport system substrate-binding protein
LRVSSVIVATAVAIALAGCGSSGKSSTSGPKTGGSLTVLEGAGYAGNWPGLDPATDTDGAANQSYMDSIFGELFELHAGGVTVGNLATGYKFTNGGKTVVIDLRQGVKFSDGTPFNAAAVVFNWQRDLTATCTCKPTFPPVQNTPPVITATGPYQVSIALKYVDAPFINGLQGNVFNWIASPTAINKMGEKAFALKPVGAGPFTVVSDTPDSELVLKKNPLYWQKGLPYLNTLTFKSVAGDEQALTAMEAGSANAYEGVSTPQLVPAFKNKGFQVTSEPGTSPYDIQLNTKIAPFNNLMARQAIYYATDAALLDKSLFNDTYPVGESFEAPAGLFFEQNVPGYIAYDLAKAKALVTQLGGLTFNLGTINVPTAVSMNEAVQTEWQAAGMHVTLQSWDLTGLIGAFIQGQWQAMLQTAGAYDPGTGVGVCFRFCSTSPFTGVHDPALDQLLLGAAGTVNDATRKSLYGQAAAYIAKNAYGPFLFSIAGYDVATKGVSAPGLTASIPSTDVNPEVLWQYASNSG